MTEQSKTYSSGRVAINAVESNLVFSHVAAAEAQTSTSFSPSPATPTQTEQHSCPVTSNNTESVAPLQEVVTQQGREGSGEHGGDKHTNSGHSQGSLPMNCGPGLCWDGGGFGVPTSLFLAILVLALANSSLRVWGISGSNRTP